MNHIRYIGYNARHNEEFLFDIPQGHDCWLFLLTHTPAFFWVEDSFREYPAGSAILFAPNTKICYKAAGDFYENDWIRFDSDEDYLSSFPLFGVPFTPSDAEYCHKLVQLIAWKSSFPSAKNERTTGQLLYLLFSELKDAACETNPAASLSPHYNELLDLRKAIYNDPQLPWNIPSMAETLHLSEGYLQVIYKKTFGISCIEDLLEARIRLAKDQLLYTDKTVSSIAEFCGYRNVEHFYRQFKRFTKKSPLAFREAK